MLTATCNIFFGKRTSHPINLVLLLLYFLSFFVVFNCLKILSEAGPSIVAAAIPQQQSAAKADNGDKERVCLKLK